MQRLDSRTVQLTEHETRLAVVHDLYMDAGYSQAESVLKMEREGTVDLDPEFRTWLLNR